MLQQKKPLKAIYLANDDADERMLFLSAMEELGLPVISKVYKDGQELLNMLYQERASLPEMIFLDIHMPVKNGFECLEEIRNAEEPLSCIKVIILSTSSSPQDIDLSYKMGADFYAIRPSSFKELKDLLQDILAIDWSATAGRNKTKFLLF
ncbi:response regulator [Flavobacterium sp. SH_e]|uniref:response regulator n=1 Tax=Flavobacterium TaxID=237 RepID=UPI0021E3B992|nr:response regulator [Flavobacterium sp. SH_e]MCV2484400.1 response regulator [Flavobacterium sp. SH_e]